MQAKTFGELSVLYLEAENKRLRKEPAQKDEVIEILKKSVGILSQP